MRRRTTGNHFHYLQILGLFLLLLAWVGIMLSFINSDWQRSISEISLWKYATALKDKSFKKNALLVWGKLFLSPQHLIPGCDFTKIGKFIGSSQKNSILEYGSPVISYHNLQD